VSRHRSIIVFTSTRYRWPPIFLHRYSFLPRSATRIRRYAICVINASCHRCSIGIKLTFNKNPFLFPLPPTPRLRLIIVHYIILTSRMSLAIGMLMTYAGGPASLFFEYTLAYTGSRCSWARTMCIHAWMYKNLNLLLVKSKPRRRSGINHVDLRREVRPKFLFPRKHGRVFLSYCPIFTGYYLEWLMLS